MLLIATDEAGYGPKLGPLVIAATTWRIPDGSIRSDHESLEKCFLPFAKPVSWEGKETRVDDSKAIFQPAGYPSESQSDEKPPAALQMLHGMVSAAIRATGFAGDGFSDWLNSVNAWDEQDRRQTRWLQQPGKYPLLSEACCEPFLDQWGQAPARLQAIHMRVITAAAFNHACGDGMNKSDLLSQATLGLARDARLAAMDGQSPRTLSDTRIYCDRHGGRRYYTGVLQHVWSHRDAVSVRPIHECKTESCYQVLTEPAPFEIRFTVKGDRFTPVAMSSLIAKYVRERMMESLNDYFQSRHSGVLKRTAGYPVDADRFLEQIEHTRVREGISFEQLVRCR